MYITKISVGTSGCKSKRKVFCHYTGPKRRFFIIVYVREKRDLSVCTSKIPSDFKRIVGRVQNFPNNPMGNYIVVGNIKYEVEILYRREPKELVDPFVIECGGRGESGGEAWAPM